MVAASTAGEPPPLVHIGDKLVFPMEEDEGWVLPVSRLKYAKRSQIPTYGTHNTVAAPVDNFPFLPPDNRRHEPHRSVTTTTPSFQRNSCSILSIDAPKHAHTSCALEGYSPPFFCNCSIYCRGTCRTTATLQRNQSESLPRPTSRSIAINDAPPKNPNTKSPQRQPVDLAAIRAEIQANLDDLDRRFSPPTTTTTTTTTQPSRQPDPPLLSPTVSKTPTGPLKHEAVDLAAIQAEIRASMERLDRLFPLPRSTTTTTTLPLRHPESPLHLPTPTKSTETEETVTPSLLMSTRIERMISNLPVRNAALWMPDIVYRRVTRDRSPEMDFPGSSNPPGAPSTFHLDYPLTNNLPRDNSNYNPDLDIHLPLPDHRQHCHQNHFLSANHATRPYNPAFDIHLMMTDYCQHRHLHHSLRAHHATRPYNPALDIHPTWTVHRPKHPQNHTCFSVASYVPGLAQNKRPP